MDEIREKRTLLFHKLSGHGRTNFEFLENYKSLLYNEELMNLKSHKHFDNLQKSFLGPQFMQSLPLRVYPYNAIAKTMNPAIDYNSVILQTKSSDDIPVAILDIPTSDSFTNRTCVSMAIGEILQDNVHYVRQLDAFVCHESGYNVMSEPTKTANTLFTFLNNPNLIREPQFDNVMMDIVRQILNPMSILQSPQHGFVHADLVTSNIVVSKDLTMPNSINCKLAKFDKSSIFWNNFRFYNNAVVTKGFEIGGFVEKRFSELWETTDNPYPVLQDSGLWPYYQLNRRCPAILYSQSFPLPIYPSYDIYTLLYSIANQVPVWSLLQQPGSKFTKFWKSAWDPTNMDSIFRALARRQMWASKSNDSTESATRTMNNVSLCHVIHDLESHHWKLRADVLPIYSAAGLPFVKLKNPKKKIIQSTEHGNICTSPCDKNNECSVVQARHWITNVVRDKDTCLLALPKND